MSTTRETRPEPVVGAARWTFLTNHAHVLILLAQHPDMILRQVAVRVGITERAVQRIVMELEEDGFVIREKAGRQNTYRLNLNQPLRHPVEGHRTIGDVVKVVLGEAGRHRQEGQCEPASQEK